MGLGIAPRTTCASGDRLNVGPGTSTFVPSHAMPVRALLLSLLLSLATGLFAQPGSTKVLLYKDRVAAAFDTVKCVKNVLKLNPLLFFRGEIPLYYERALTSRLSLEVGLGVTLRNYMAMTFAGDDVDDFGAGIEILARPSYRMGARWYHTIDLEPQGWYTQVEFVHLTYAKDVRMKGPNGVFTEQKLRDERTYNDIRLLTGYQMLAASSNWMFDLYGGLAYRARHSLIVHETRDLSTDNYVYEVVEQNDPTLGLFLGVKVGMGF